jgi:hypothetical protein
MKLGLAILSLLCYWPAVACGQWLLGTEFSQEAAQFQQSCTSFSSIFGCGQLLVTGTPLHITAGTIAPGNGVAFGPAFVFDKDLTAWRMNLNADAVASTNESWRAGVYLKLAKTPTKPVTVVILKQRPTTPLKASPPPPAPEINLYIQAISLNRLDFYGLGNETPRTSLALFGMREIIAGGNGILPLGNSGFAAYGELNGRFVNISSGSGNPSVPSVQQVYAMCGDCVPGLSSQPGFLQAGEGVRFSRDFRSHFDLDYAAVFQEFIAPSDTVYSFRRLNLDFSHTIWLYGRTAATSSIAQYGPDGNREALQTHNYVRNRSGSINLDARLSESFFPASHAVPFYFQPTLGGTDINGDAGLASYPDYRFRAPNLLEFRGTFEHSIWGPIGAEFTGSYGRVALTHSDLGFDHFLHSRGAGLTIRAGNFPAVSLLFAWGGHEGTHTVAYISPGLLGGASRPSLF